MICNLDQTVKIMVVSSPCVIILLVDILIDYNKHNQTFILTTFKVVEDLVVWVDLFFILDQIINTVITKVRTIVLHYVMVMVGGQTTLELGVGSVHFPLAKIVKTNLLSVGGLDDENVCLY